MIKIRWHHSAGLSNNGSSFSFIFFWLQYFITVWRRLSSNITWKLNYRINKIWNWRYKKYFMCVYLPCFSYTDKTTQLISLFTKKIYVWLYVLLRKRTEWYCTCCVSTKFKNWIVIFLKFFVNCEFQVVLVSMIPIFITYSIVTIRLICFNSLLTIWFLDSNRHHG